VTIVCKLFTDMLLSPSSVIWPEGGGALRLGR